MSASPLRVLLVPDSIHWVTGTIAKNIARFNPWIEATVASGPVIDQVFAENPELMNNFDLVHFTCPYASKQWLPRFRDVVPCVTSHHHVTDWDLLSHNLDGDAIIVGSPEWAEDLRSRGADMARVFCVPYGVDANLFVPATDVKRDGLREKLGVKTEATVIGFFGKNSSNDDDRKGIDVFIKAAVALKEELPSLTVLIVGPGWQQLTNVLTAAGVGCIWIPFVQELSELAIMYQLLDFYWVTARVEGGPVTLLEAMSTEVCCLTTPVGIAREIVKDGKNGVVLPFNNPQAFVDRTLELMTDQVVRASLGRQARLTILEEMHVGVTSRGVKDVYERAFKNFAERRQTVSSVDVSAIANSFATMPDLPQNSNEVVPLAGIPVSLHRRVRMLENLAWSEHLVLYHRQRALAARMILSEWFRNPISPLPLRVFLRRFLPVSFVARLVRIKNRSEVSPHLVTTYPPTNKA
jgi:glycosyltransferase involved in cell wall biosynthesis